jgi:hypothetical protein
MSFDLEKTKRQIEAMPRFHQIEALRILNDDETVVLNENPNGVFINLSQVPDATVMKLETYIAYVEQQQSCLEQQESAKESLSNRFFKHHRESATTNIKLPRNKGA